MKPLLERILVLDCASFFEGDDALFVDFLHNLHNEFIDVGVAIG